MESLVVMINLFGAVALLLFGLAQVRDGATRAWRTVAQQARQFHAR